MNNVLKHAAPKTVSVSVERRAESVIAIVEDDGVGFGFDLERASVGTSHIGLASMGERVAMVGGALTVESRRPGAGTTIRVKLPLS